MYTILCKELFKENITTISDFNIEAEIDDICYLSKDYGIAFSIPNRQCLALLKNKEVIYPWVGILDREIKVFADRRQSLLSYPSSLSCSKDGNVIFVVEKNGLSVAKVETCSRSVFSTMDNLSIGKTNNLFSGNSDNFKSYLDYNEGYVYLSCEKINMSFVIPTNASSMKNFVGTGIPRYSVCSNFAQSDLRSPTGISFNGTRVYIADNGNNCIRSVYGDKIELVVGFPGFIDSKDGQGTSALLKSVSKIRARGQNVCFLDDNKIRMFKESNRRVYTIYESKNLVTFDLKDDKLYILEKG
jgi:hypothetical protein